MNQSTDDMILNSAGRKEIIEECDTRTCKHAYTQLLPAHGMETLKLDAKLVINHSAVSEPQCTQPRTN